MIPLLGSVLEPLLSALRRRRAAEFWGRQHRASQQERAFWLSVPEIMGWVNLKVSGEPQIWPLSWFLLSLPADRLPVDNALSIGCGPGNLEREVIRHEAARHITAIDISPDSLRLARRLAHEAGCANRITYRRASARQWLRDHRTSVPIDLIFFHGSLHHIQSLEEVLRDCARCLEKGRPGLLYVDEYIGPSRDEWNDGHLGYAAALFARIPAAFRQSSRLTSPVAFEDPTEMIRSSQILAAIRDRFEVLEFRPYYGNILMPLVCAIKPEGLPEPPVQSVLREAMQLEDYLAGRGLLDPMYAVIVAKPGKAVEI